MQHKYLQHHIFRTGPVILAAAAAICVHLSAQTGQLPAAKANNGRALLEKEPEIRAAGGMIDDWESQVNKNPKDPTKPSNGALALGGYVTIRNRMVVIDRLEQRLQQEVIGCNFCADKQAELSELLREELQWAPVYGFFKLREADPIGEINAQTKDRVSRTYGQPNLDTQPKDRWSNMNVAFEEAGDIMKRHCLALNPKGGAQLTICQGQNSFGDRPTQSVFEMARAHEKAWAGCFRTNNWVRNESQRTAYESCMKHEDPLTQLCATDQAANPEIAKHECPASFVVRGVDIDHLLNWTDRYAGHAPAPSVRLDPSKAVVQVAPDTSAGVEIALLDPVVPPPPNQASAIRGEVARDIPGSGVGVVGAMLAIPKGTPAALSVQSYIGGVNIYLTRLTLASGGTIDFRNQVQTFPANGPRRTPAPGSGEVIKFALPPTSRVSMPRSEFDAKVKEYAASLGLSGDKAASDPGRRRIYARSTITVSFVEDADLKSAMAGTTVRARTNGDIDDSQQSAHPDMLHVPKGTEVYLRVSARPGDMRPYITMTITPDHLVLNGTPVPLTAKSQNFNVIPKEPAASARGATADQSQVVIKSGAPFVVIIAEDTFTPAGGAIR